MKKTRDEIVQDILTRFEDGTEMVNIEPGSIVRTFSEVLSEEFNQLYSEISLVSTMAFVTTAKGQFLDLLGAILNCYRLVGEEDENFRVRITNQVYVVAGANQTAIRLKLLEVPGIADVIMEEFTKGTGSFTVYVISNQMETPEGILSAARAVVEEHKAYGVYAEVRKPVLISMNLMVRLIFEEGTPPAELTSVKESVKTALKDYMDNIDIGGTFLITEALRRMKNTSDSILDLGIERMNVNQAEQFIRNISATKGERIFLEHVEIV